MTLTRAKMTRIVKEAFKAFKYTPVDIQWDGVRPTAQYIRCGNSVSIRLNGAYMEQMDEEVFTECIIFLMERMLNHNENVTYSDRLQEFVESHHDWATHYMIDNMSRPVKPLKGQE